MLTKKVSQLQCLVSKLRKWISQNKKRLERQESQQPIAKEYKEFSYPKKSLKKSKLLVLADNQNQQPYLFEIYNNCHKFFKQADGDNHKTRFADNLNPIRQNCLRFLHSQFYQPVILYNKHPDNIKNSKRIKLIKKKLKKVLFKSLYTLKDDINQKL
ncbi:hypothetical protein FQA39_LY04658 [Lamprigera yunnana]|nr:hypothetical protein FQA39_LY04658 [Lamprigera yunnana]